MGSVQGEYGKSCCGITFLMRIYICMQVCVKYTLYCFVLQVLFFSERDVLLVDSGGHRGSIKGPELEYNGFVQIKKNIHTGSYRVTRDKRLFPRHSISDPETIVHGKIITIRTVTYYKTNYTYNVFYRCNFTRVVMRNMPLVQYHHIGYFINSRYT